MTRVTRRKLKQVQFSTEVKFTVVGGCVYTQLVANWSNTNSFF